MKYVYKKRGRVKERVCACVCVSSADTAFARSLLLFLYTRGKLAAWFALSQRAASAAAFVQSDTHSPTADWQTGETVRLGPNR